MTNQQKRISLSTIGGGLSIASLVFFWNVYSDMDARVRETEQSSVKSEVHIEKLIESTDRIEKKVDKILSNKCEG